MANVSSLSKAIEKDERYGAEGHDNARRVRVIYRAFFFPTTTMRRA